MGALKTHLSRLESAIASGQVIDVTPSNLVPEVNMTAHTAETATSSVHGAASAIGGARKGLAQSPRGLVVVFKNSPDDWFALTKIASTPEGRIALAHGGIICEGFSTAEMQASVQKVLHGLGAEDIPVAAGMEYSEADISKLPANFKGEIALNRERQASRAFEHLEAPKTKVSLTPEALLARAAKNAGTENKVDVMILGEGVDVMKHLETSGLSARLGKVYVMGGGRIDGATQKFIFTRPAPRTLRSRKPDRASRRSRASTNTGPTGPAFFLGNWRNCRPMASNRRSIPSLPSRSIPSLRWDCTSPKRGSATSRVRRKPPPPRPFRFPPFASKTSRWPRKVPAFTG